MNQNVTPKMLVAIETWLLTGDATKASKAAGVAPRTFHAWRKLPSFQAALREAESAALAQFSTVLVTLAESAALALRDGLSPSEPVTVRLRAASLILDSILKMRELVSFEERLTALENRHNAQRNEKPT